MPSTVPGTPKEVRAAEPAAASRWFCASALRIRAASVGRFGSERAIEIVGHSAALVDTLRRMEKVAPYQEPVLIQGESGVGKESLAQAIHLLGPRRTRPFVSVNCPQFQEGNLTVSELFGHKRGSFTGAMTDRKGCFETGEGGLIFLDEIGDLGMNAQVMLLRALSAGEFQALGSDVVRRADVRIVSATNRPLNQLVGDGSFRNDLLFRLRYFLLQPPPLRERGDDWLLLLDYCLERMHRRYGIAKRFSEESLRLLESYAWPGNVRELLGIASTGYALSDADQIHPVDFAERLDEEAAARESDLDPLLRKLKGPSSDFWKQVHEPFLDREMSRREVRRLISRGLNEVGGSYRKLLELWRLPAAHYQKFRDFLRHHRLKPTGFEDEET
jgi:transcriptional regulator with GAF, ATPase, and Fis domain